MKRKDKEIIREDIESDFVFEIVHLFKRYGKRMDYAVSDVHFSARSGEIVGLLGANGAGKSTTLKCLTGMIPITEGEIRICGHSIKSEPVPAKRCFSFVTDNHSVFVKMTGMQYLMFMSDIYGVPTEERKPRIAELEKCFELGEKIDCLISSYSHGMKQKICMMGSLMHKPKLWIMDEPMVGLDPRTSRAVINYMRSYAAEGGTILFSSHNLDVVRRVCDRAVVIKNGRMKADIVIKDFFLSHPDVDLESYLLDEELSEASDESVEESGKTFGESDETAVENDAAKSGESESDLDLADEKPQLSISDSVGAVANIADTDGGAVE